MNIDQFATRKFRSLLIRLAVYKVLSSLAWKRVVKVVKFSMGVKTVHFIKFCTLKKIATKHTFGSLSALLQE